jgi:urease accessory protein
MSRTAQGRLRFERAGELTALSDAYAESPLRLLTPRRQGPGAWAFTSTLGGGLVDGDRLRLQIEVGPGARAIVSSQGPTRVFRGRCSSVTEARVAAGGAMALLPDPSACFSGARFEQRTEVELAGGASLLWWDVLSAGRDRWGFSSMRSALLVRREGTPLIDEAWLLDEAQGSVRARMGRFGALATLLLCGPLFACIELRARQAGRLIEAVSPLGGGALLLRLAAESTEEAVAALRQRLSILPSLLGDDPWRRDASHPP